MTIRLLADREPYASYIKEGDPEGSFFFCEDPSRAVDVEVLPAELFLATAEAGLPLVPIFAYGPLRLMAPAFAAGCNDYLRDPWSLTELLARASRYERLRFLARSAGFELRNRALSLGAEPGRSIALNEAESKILRLLLLNQGTVVTRQALALELWGQDRGPSRAIDVHIGRLRARLDTLVPGSGSCLRPCRGLGYRLDVDIC
jgi:DNA-binding response OmpR family regulator